MSDKDTIKEEVKFNMIYSPLFFVSMGFGYIYQIMRIGFLIGMLKAKGN